MELYYKGIDKVEKDEYIRRPIAILFEITTNWKQLKCETLKMGKLYMVQSGWTLPAAQ